MAGNIIVGMPIPKLIMALINFNRPTKIFCRFIRIKCFAIYLVVLIGLFWVRTYFCEKNPGIFTFRFITLLPHLREIPEKTMNGMQLQLHVPTHTSIYLGVLDIVACAKTL